MSNRQLEDLLPLRALVFDFLLLFNEDDRHGYGLLKEIARQTEGHVTLDPANLYRSIKRMIRTGLVEQSGRKPAPESNNERRRYYAITVFGREVLKAEAERLDKLMVTARARKLISKTERPA